jgi:hypothetical protein
MICSPRGWKRETATHAISVTINILTLSFYSEQARISRQKIEALAFPSSFQADVPAQTKGLVYVSPAIGSP